MNPIVGFFILLLTISISALSQPNKSERFVTKSEIVKWKKAIINGSDFKRYSSVFMFPKGQLSRRLWKEEVLEAAKDSNELLRRAIALMIGNKRICKAESIPILLNLLTDSSEFVAMDAIFSLASFGSASIGKLFSLIENGGFPYCTNLETPPHYDFSLDTASCPIARFNFLDGYKWTTSDFTERIGPLSLPPTFYSRNAMRALFCLRQIGDTVLYYLPSEKSLDNYYLVYLLEGINISSSNLHLYYQQLKRAALQYQFTNDNVLYANFLFKKICQRYSLDSCRSILRDLDSSLVEKANSTGMFTAVNTENERIVTAIRSDIDSARIKRIDPSKIAPLVNTATMNVTWECLAELNKITLQKIEFRQYEYLFKTILERGRLDSRYKTIMPFLLVIISDIGDSALSMHTELTKYLENTLDRNQRYLAIKALLDIHLSNNESYTYLQSDIFKKSFDELSHSSNLLTEGRILSWNIRGNLVEEGYNVLLLHKIYLDKHFQLINQNVSSFKSSDTQAQKLVSRFASDQDCRVREYVAYLIGLSDSLNNSLKGVLTTLLQDKDYYVRINASKSLIHFEEKLDEKTLAFAHFINLEDYLADILQSDKDRISNNAQFGGLDFPKGRFVGLKLPPFPDPPAMPTLSGSIGCLTCRANNLRLNVIFERLIADLKSNGYRDFKLFAFRDGAGLMTQVERIKKDGSIDRRSRWTLERLRPENVYEIWNGTFFADKGGFQAVVFLVSDAERFDQFSNNNIFDYKEYSSLFSNGGDYVPESMKGIYFKGKNIKTLIYQWRKDPYGHIVSKGNDKNLSFSHSFNSIGLKQFGIR